MSNDIEGPQRRALPEWPATLDVGMLLAAGWQPKPFRQFILKVHSRCNLACDYCYVYTLADQSWSGQPLVMSSEIVAVAARRIAEHAARHRIPAVQVILHGGEPLLAGRDRLSEIITTMRAAAPDVDVEFSMQTNGVLLDEDYLALFADQGVRVGVSLDGGEEVNDRHRKTVGGRGSYRAVARALELLGRPEYRSVYGGILCTIDLANDPVEIYESLASFLPPKIDLLLPHGTWAEPPPGQSTDTSAAPYADWLITVFDHWYGQGQPVTGIRLFEEIIHLLLGGTSGVETIGLTPSTLLVIETDGTIEQSDFLKVVGPGAAMTGLNITDHDLDQALHHPGVAARQLGLEGLSETCRACRFSTICGGGLYAHRYRPGTGHLNPSVYCADLYRLIHHVRSRIQRDLPKGQAH
ncbi:FxsB family radical SAM/SPASM domain protein [Acrocarpospora macrocephala]|uniref:Radical SAM protein n=2 Tax=Acrocarpospora macrocephala TaxID=150177 RepID=A0A5M3X1N6_9ACTN|nr:radical SAM protein [Acrocarpospora macrocephala]